MGKGREVETELMPSLVGGNTELIGSKLKSLKGISKPNSEPGPDSWEH
jgi:hypothetical protein